jgi:hypothetical protein
MGVLMEKHKIPILFEERIFMDTRWFSNTLTNFSKCFMCKTKLEDGDNHKICGLGLDGSQV